MDNDNGELQSLIQMENLLLLRKDLLDKIYDVYCFYKEHRQELSIAAQSMLRVHYNMLVHEYNHRRGERIINPLTAGLDARLRAVRTMRNIQRPPPGSSASGPHPQSP